MQSPIRIAVFQPVFTEGAGLDFRLLGLQCWLADRFSDVVQLEGMSMLNASPGEKRELVNSTPPDDEQIHGVLGATQARFGLISSFVVLGGVPHLAHARLVEHRGPALHTTARWKPERDADQPAIMAHFLWCSVIRAIVVDPQLPDWPQMLGTHDVRLAAN
jgi:hypothetical protein